MFSHSNRRTFLKNTAAASAATIGFGSTLRYGLAQDLTPEPTVAPVSVGEGGTEISIWVQDFGPIVTAYQEAAANYVAAGNDVKVTVQPIAFADLLAKVLPSVAAGNEADIIMGYTDWYVATDISRLFLNLDGLLGTQAELEETLFPTTLATLDMPEGSIYYLPLLAGARSAVTTYNGAMFQQAGIDATSLATWENLVEAGRELTVMEGGRMTVAGLSPVSAALSLVKNWVWQTGGEFYNGETGEWTLATAEGEASLARLIDLGSGDNPTYSYDLLSVDNEFDVWNQGKVASHMNGAWTIGVSEEAVEANGIPTPLLAEATNEVVYPEHIAVTTLSRRLADDDTKLQHCVGIVQELYKPESLIDTTNQYSGLLCSKELYADPKIEDTAFGPVSKLLAESVWPRAQFPRDHVANQAPAGVELDRAMRGEISIQEALSNADAYLNDQEQQARERIGHVNR
ncbi:MAG: extracellular solute-binding protein [Chloroflexota bacterium]|nr:extracellular solute-binding protein [Chloroflexota bacterium]